MKKKKVKLTELIPTQIFLTKETPDFFEKSGVPNGYPQIWDIEGRLMIADGHHRLYYLLMMGIDELTVECFDYHEYKGNAGAEWIPEELIKQANQCQTESITSLLDLKGRIV